jgi:carboxyl-terminal processing protease
VSPAPPKKADGSLFIPSVRFSVSWKLLHDRWHDSQAATSSGSSLVNSSTLGGSSAARMTLVVCWMLTNKSFQTSGWRTLDYKPVERAWGNIPGWWKGDPSNIAPDTAHTFLKPVIVLTNAHTYSAAEDFVVAFDTMQRGTLIGETTGGSTGQPLMFALPGGGTARICTKDDSYPDGRRFEGVGIAPQITVTPSVSDIRHGRDAGLERAVETLHTATLDRLQ